MTNFDDVTKENIKEHNPNWPQIPNHSNKVLTIGGSGSGKTNSLFNLINHHSDIDKNCLYSKDLNEAKIQSLIKKRKVIRTKHFNDSKAFFKYSDDMDNIYKYIEEYNLNKKRKRLVVFDDMTAVCLVIKNLIQ